MTRRAQHTCDIYCQFFDIEWFQKFIRTQIILTTVNNKTFDRYAKNRKMCGRVTVLCIKTKNFFFGYLYEITKKKIRTAFHVITFGLNEKYSLEKYSFNIMFTVISIVPIILYR